MPVRLPSVEYPFPEQHTDFTVYRGVVLRAPLVKLNTDFEQFACMIETRNGLLVQFLLETGFPVYPLNPGELNIF